MAAAPGGSGAAQVYGGSARNHALLFIKPVHGKADFDRISHGCGGIEQGCHHP